MKLSEATKLIGVLASYYPNREVPPETFQLWARELQVFDVRDAMAAVQDWATHSKFMPSLAELIDVADDFRKLRLRTEMEARPMLNAAVFDFDGWVKAAHDNPWGKRDA